MAIWSNINANLSGANILDLHGTADISGTFIRGQSGAIFSSNNGGISWSDVTPGTDPTGGAASAVDYFWIEPSPTTAGTWLVAARKDQTADNWKSWVAITEDSGATYTWTTITGGAGSTIEGSGSVIDVTSDEEWNLIYGTKAVNTHPAQYQSISRLTDTKAAVTWTYGEFPDASMDNVHAAILDISGFGVTVGASVQINEHADPDLRETLNQRSVRVDSGGFLTAFNRLSDSQSAYTFELIASTVSGATISPGVATTVVDGDDSNRECLNYNMTNFADNSILLAYWQYEASAIPVVYVRRVDVTGTTITLRPAYDLITASVSSYRDVDVTTLSDTRTVAVYSVNTEDTFKFNVVDVAGTSLINGPRILMDPVESTAASTIQHDMAGLTDDSFVFVWGKSGSAHAIIGSVSGVQGSGSIAFGSKKTISNDAAPFSVSVDKVSASTFIVSHITSHPTNPSKIQVIGTVSDGSAITFGPSFSIIGAASVGPLYGIGHVKTMSNTTALEVHETDASAGGTKLRTIVSQIAAGGDAKALGAAISRGGASGYVTYTDNSNLKIDSYDLPSLTKNATTSLGTGTFGQSASKTRVAYPATRSRYYSTALDNGEVFVYGRMAGIPAVGGGDTGDPTHLARSTTSGTTYTLLANAFGADHVGAVEAGNNIFAMRNLAAGAGAFYAGATVPTLKSTVGFNVAPGGLYLSQDGYIVAGASGNSSTRFAFTVGPYNLWWNLTWNYPTSPATQTVTGMIIV